MNSRRVSLDHLVGAGEQCRGDRETERFSDFQVYRQVVFARQFDWKITGLLALENPGHVHARTPVSVRLARSVTDQLASTHNAAENIARWDTVERCQSNQLIAASVKERAGADQERTNAGFFDDRIGGFDFLCTARFNCNNFLPESAGTRFDFASLDFKQREICILQHCNDLSLRDQFSKQSKAFARDRNVIEADAGEIAAGSIDVGYEADRDRIGSRYKDNWNAYRRRLCCKRGIDTTHNCCDLTRNKLTGEARQPLILPISPTGFKPDFVTGKPGVAQTLTQRRNQMPETRRLALAGEIQSLVSRAAPAPPPATLPHRPTQR